MPVDLPLRVATHEPLGARHFLLTLEAPETFPAWDPGQFVMLAVTPSRDEEAPLLPVDPLLRRPFSIYNPAGRPEGRIQIFYKALGRGTRLLAQTRPGDRLRCLGPLGRGFAPARSASSRLLLVAGGIGAASLHPLALQEAAAGGRPILLYGCRSREDLAGIRPTQQAGIECRVATDDGSVGHAGFASDLLDRFLQQEGRAVAAEWVVCACGPTPMMRATALVAARHGAPCFVSLESPMACGFGVCVGCVVATRGLSGAATRYLRICVDGPVLHAPEVRW